MTPAKKKAATKRAPSKPRAGGVWDLPEAPIEFATFAKWYAWLKKHHAHEPDVWLRMHRKGSGRPSIAWAEAVDGALCFGWIDGIRKRLDETSFVQRFTPRRAGSVWSTKNSKRFRELEAEGFVHAAGQNAFAAREERKSGIYSFERERPAELPPAFAKRFRADRAAWAFFQAQAPWYRRTAAHWIVSAKQEATRERRLATLIADSAAGQHIRLLRREQPAK
jgi:uncharacterized protein YdeI (YjbR/CyaY-like superfamily)